MKIRFEKVLSKHLGISVSMTCLSFISAPVSAQSSLTLYGDLDIGVQYLTKANSKGSSVFGLQSGNESPTRFGMLGEEDLGDGYKAIFRLEGGFNIVNGNYTVPNTPFDRYAYVGIDSPYGRVTFGRQRSLLFERSVAYDPMYLAQFSRRYGQDWCTSNFMSGDFKRRVSADPVDRLAPVHRL